MRAGLSRNRSSIASGCESRDCVFYGFGIATGYALDNRGGQGVGIRVPVRSRILTSLYRPYGLRDPPNLLSMDTGALSLGGKAEKM
jgi:hypothetical protein